MTYRVIYELDVEANTPDEAAREAWASMTDPEAFPPVLEVLPPDWPRDEAIVIDLAD